MKDPRPFLLMVDTETGGLDPSRHALLSIGAVAFDTSLEEHSAIEILVVPNKELTVEASALRVNKLSLPMLEEEGLSETDAIAEFEEFSRRYRNGSSYPLLCGWNTHFDIGDNRPNGSGFLRELYHRNGVTWNFGWRQFDVQDLWAFANIFQADRVDYGGLQEAAFQTFGQKVKHGALEDAQLTLNLLRSFLK